MVVEEAGPTRQSRRERTKTTKALEQEKMISALISSLDWIAGSIQIH